jgi:hypothetical protein
MRTLLLAASIVALSTAAAHAGIGCNLTDDKGNALHYSFARGGPGYTNETLVTRNGAVISNGGPVWSRAFNSAARTMILDQDGWRLIYEAKPSVTDVSDATLFTPGGTRSAVGTCVVEIDAPVVAPVAVAAPAPVVAPTVDNSRLDEIERKLDDLANRPAPTPAPPPAALPPIIVNAPSAPAPVIITNSPTPAAAPVGVNTPAPAPVAAPAPMAAPAPAPVAASALLTGTANHVFACTIQPSDEGFPRSGNATVTIDGARQQALVEMTGIIDGDGHPVAHSRFTYPLNMHIEPTPGYPGFMVGWNPNSRGVDGGTIQNSTGQTTAPFYMQADIPNADWPSWVAKNADSVPYYGGFDCHGVLTSTGDVPGFPVVGLTAQAKAEAAADAQIAAARRAEGD